ncbi:MAG: hypothetical protein ABIO70_03850 [Pseudomonadota bacterium]
MARRPCDGPECGEEPKSERPRTLVFGQALTFEAGERVDRVKLALRQAVASASAVGEGIEGPAQIPWLGATEREIEIYTTLSCLRRAGVEPNPYVDQYPTAGLADQDLAIALAATLEVQPGIPRGDEHVQPNAKLGMRNPLLMLPEETPFGPASGSSPGKVSTTMYGSMWQMMRDMSLAGLSIASHSHTGDLAWFILAAMRKEDSDHDQIPKPNDLIEQLTEEDFFAFRGFTLFVLCCHLYGMTGVPVLWDYGGGSRFNLGGDEGICEQVGLPRWSPISRAEVNAGRPTHQSRVTLASAEGWGRWYWAHTVEGAESQLYREALFQRWGVNVWCSEDESDYMRECARRKSLGAAAYGMAVGRYFAALDAALRSCLSASLTDYIPYVDCCNELDGAWAIDVRASTAGMWDKDGDYRIVWELGRLVALLAGGIQQEFGAMRFRMPDLFGSTEIVPWEARCEWLRFSIDPGLTDEVDRWNHLWDVIGAAAPSGTATTAEIVAWVKGYGMLHVLENLADELTDDDQYWILTMYQSGGDDAFFWPLSGGWNKRDLVHQVGLHFFQSLTTTNRGGTVRTYPPSALGVGEAYGDELHLQACADALVELCVDPLNNLGFDLRWSLMAMCHPATQPEGQGVDDDSWYEGTTPAHQAGIMARRLLYTRALHDKPDMVLWYTVMADIENWDQVENPGPPPQDRTDPWGLYSATGYRNDVVFTNGICPLDEFQGTAGKKPRDFEQGHHAWRRRSWFTLRRLVWLLERTVSAKPIFVDAEKRQVVLRLVARRDRPYHDPSAVIAPHATTPVPTYRYAYIAWMDELAPPGDDFFTFLLTGAERGYHRLALVPTVAYDWNAATVDPRTGYPDIETPDWSNDLVQAAVIPTISFQVVHVWRADGTNNPAPLCLLTDAESAFTAPVLVPSTPAEGIQAQSRRVVLGPEESDAAPQELQALLQPK